MFKWAIEEQVHVKSTAQEVWRAWTDVASWPQWDHEIRASALKGPFVVGAVGTVTPKGWFPCSFRIAIAEPDRRFSDVTRLLFSQITFHHFVAPWWDGHVRVVFRVEVKGLFAPWLRWTMRRRLAKILPQTMRQFASHLQSINR